MSKIAKTANALHRILVQGKADTKLVAEIIGIHFDESLSDTQYVLVLWDARCIALALAKGALQTLLDSGKVCKGCALRVDKYQVETRSDKLKILIIDDAIVLEKDQFRTLPDQEESKRILFDHPVLCEESKKRKRSDSAENVPSAKMIKEEKYVDDFETLAGLNPGRPRADILAKVDNSNLTTIRLKKTNGQSKKLDLELMDSKGKKMLAICWGGIADKIHANCKKGNLIVVQKSTYELRPKNATFNCFDHPYEISMNAQTKIKQVTDDSPLQKRFKNVSEHINLDNAVDIAHVRDLEEKTEVDVLALVLDNGEPETLGGAINDRVLRKVALVDKNKIICYLNIWNKSAHEPWVCDEKLVGSVIAIFRAQVSNFRNTVCLTKCPGTRVVVNPDVPAAKELKALMQDKSILSLHKPSYDAQEMTIEEFKALRESDLVEPKYVRFHGVIINVLSEPHWFIKRCPDKMCNYLVLPTSELALSASEDEEFVCLQCQTVGNPVHIFSLQVQVADHTGTETVRLYHSVVLKLVPHINMSTFLKHSQEEQLAVLRTMENKMYQWVIEVKAKSKYLQLQAVSVKKVNASLV